MPPITVEQDPETLWWDVWMEKPDGELLHRNTFLESRALMIAEKLQSWYGGKIEVQRSYENLWGYC